MDETKSNYYKYGLEDEDFVSVSPNAGSNAHACEDEIHHIVEQMSLNTATIKKAFDHMNVDGNMEKIYQSSVSLKSELTEMNQKLRQEMIQQSDKLDSNFYSIQQQLSSLRMEVSQLNQTLEQQAMNQRLDWAFKNVDKISDVLGWEDDHNNGFYRRNSHQLSKKILLAFRRGEGYDITSFRHTDHLNEESRKVFRVTICERIHQLLGHKPRMSMSDGRYTIYYS